MEACGGKNVNIEGVEGGFDGGLLVHMVDKLRLSHSPCGSQQNMGLVLNDADKLLCLFLSVAEIGLWDDACDEKRIRHINSIFWQRYKIFQLYKFYYRNSIFKFCNDFEK